MIRRTNRSHRWGLLFAVGLALASALADDRARAAAPAGRYTLTTYTAFDTRTGLTWQRSAPLGSMRWADADQYCRKNTAGLPGGGWRLPSMKELVTLVDRAQVEPALDTAAFSKRPQGYFWTSSAGPGGDTAAVEFTRGYVQITPVDRSLFVRCVR